MRSSSAAWAGFGDRDDVDLGPAARGAGDQVEALAFTQAERLEEGAGGLGFLDRVRGERVADRVADPLREERPESGGGLDDPGGGRAGLGDAEVQRMVDGLGEEPVGVDHDRHVGGLDGDLDVVEVDVAEVVELPDRAGDERLGGDAAVAFGDVGVEAAGVHADADRQAAVLRLAGDGFDLVGLADVARVEPQPLHAGFHRREREAVLEVDVGDDRDRGAGHDLGQPFGGRLLVAGAAHDVAARAGEGVDLGEGGVDVGGLGGRHRLDRDRGVAADRDLARRGPGGSLGGVASRAAYGRRGRVLTPSRCEIWCRGGVQPVTSAAEGLPDVEERGGEAQGDDQDQDHRGERHQLAEVDPDLSALDLRRRPTRRRRRPRARRRRAGRAAG